MKKFLFALAVVVSMFTTAAAAQCYPSGNCQMGDPGVECYLFNHDCYPASDCDAPGCPGLKCTDLYLCYQYDEPCGNVTCTGCAGCASPLGIHAKETTRAKAILAFIHRVHSNRS